MQFLQAHDLGLGKRFVTEISQRRALPQRQRLTQRLGCLFRIPCRQGLAALRDQLLELADVQLFGKSRLVNSSRCAAAVPAAVWVGGGLVAACAAGTSSPIAATTEKSPRTAPCSHTKNETAGSRMSRRTRCEGGAATRARSLFARL